MIRDSYIPYREQIVDTDIPSYSSEEIASLMDDPKSDIWLAEENGEIAGMAAGTELGPCAYHLKMLFFSDTASTRELAARCWNGLKAGARNGIFHSAPKVNCCDARKH